MTSKLTRLTDDELTETLRQATSGYPLPASVEGNLRHAFAELQERRKTEKDSEPVAWRWRSGPNAWWQLASRGDIDGEVEPLYRHAQPAPVVQLVPEEPPEHLLPKGNSRDATYRRGTAIQAWKQCRAAMLQAGNSPVIPDGYVMVPKEPTEAMMLHKSGCQHHAWDDPDCAMRQTRRLIWSHMLAAAPQLAGSEPATVPDRWIPVSELMPERGDYLVTDGRDFDVQSFNGEQFIPGFVWEDAITHWMPLPAVPQEVK
ncbi:DUF551 domain-containing protein [Raoultella ornithinolytica]|uniref:DUF551 domain-containing protein n=1 Tax=Raoultella ornithinolytica TaxID=54291 RepID=UPI0010D89C6F|nr:DUF551 domain-containing protein [Raoultella ornithinolytica]VTN41139.1 Uncharacterised protein [Raoultella ornithinolytica]